MAKATMIRPKPVKQPPVKVILELTEGEADFILGVTAKLGGDREKSPRKYSDRIQAALTDALGYDWSRTDAYKLSSGGGIYFNSYNSAEANA